LRLRTDGGAIAFNDRAQGAQSQLVASAVGDFVLYRADGQFAYQLAVVVDDADQGVTDVVRGADLLDSTARQILLQRLLGVPSPRYLHVPVALDASGRKISKQNAARPLDEHRERALREALRFLGQPETGDLDEAVAAWDVSRIPRRRTSAPAAG
jgi:glutamyl-Q tRNA(Asp) synthetase